MSRWAYYNENNPDAVLWLKQLIKEKIIMDGAVDDRSIHDVQPTDLRGFRRCHFFAGIGGWDYALQLAGWPDDRPVWTGSCPCQSFSQAGKQQGFDDPRHLWPVWFRLISECRPATIFGEQVAAAISHGWLDLVGTDMESQDYALGSAVLGAHSAGAFHKRDRLYFVAHDNLQRRDRQSICLQSGESRKACVEITGGGIVGKLANAEHERRKYRRIPSRKRSHHGYGRLAASGGDANLRRLQPHVSADGRMVNASQPRLQRLAGDGFSINQSGRNNTHKVRPFAASNLWIDAEWMLCKDGKYRAVKPGIHPLANGLPGCMVHSGNPCPPDEANQSQEARKMRITGYGNAIVPQTAALFIQAFF